MKKLLSLFVALISTTSLWAYNFKYGDLYYRTISDTTVTVERSTDYMFDDMAQYTGLTDVVIPETVVHNSITYKVTNISDLAFHKCSTLSSIFIPNSVTEVGGGVFAGCSSLENVNLSENIQELPFYLHYRPDRDEFISAGFFEGCSALTSIVIPNSVKNIGENAFKGGANLVSISIPNDITYIGVNAFEDTPWYSTLPDGELYLGQVFYKYKGEMPENTSIRIKDGTIGITTHAFEGRSKLVSVIIPNSVTQIGGAIFSNCTSLKNVVLPIGIKSLGSYCTFYTTISPSLCRFDGFFSNCSSLTSVTLPHNIETIGENAFSSCTSLDTIFSYPQDPPIRLYGGYSYDEYFDAFYNTNIKEIFVHKKSLQLYQNQWSGVAENISPIPGEALFVTPIQTKNITQTTATINAVITNTDSAYSYNVGYISKEDTVYLEYSDTLEFTVTGLYPNQSNQITLFVGKTNEHFVNYLFEQINIQTKSITISVQVPTTTQTTAKITLSCNAGDATPIEQGIILTHPNEQKDTIPFEINQTDTIIRGLAPYSNYVATGYCIIKEGNLTFASGRKFTTKDVDVYAYTYSKTQTKLHVGVQYSVGDATIYDKGLVIHFPNGIIDTMSIQNTHEGMSGDTLLTQLRINSEYDVYGFVRTKEGGLKVGNGNAIYTKNIESTITSSNRTQTTIPLSASLELGDAIDYNRNGLQWTTGSSFNSGNYETIYFENGVLNLDTTITNLSPNTQYAFRLFHYSLDETGKEYCVYGNIRKFTTASVALSEPTLQTTGQTYIEVQTSNAYGDATLVEEVVEVATSKYNTPEQRVDVAGRSNVIINNLMPDTKYYFRSVLTTQEAGTMESEWYVATTEEITLATGEADGISNSSAFLHGTIDCDTMSRTEIGFEWKRSDAPSTVKPQRLLVVDRMDENLIFRLEGLSSDRYYDFRTFCLYNGKEYYGEWVGFLTSDKDILIPPSVQTREAEITDLGVLMKGFVVAGTEVILQRGFECWREASDQVATTVAEGAIMSSYIPEAWSYTTYKYRAYAKTPAGTTYGEILEVATEYVATNIADIIVNASSNSAQVTWTMVEQADYYILTLYSDESMTEVIGVYTVDKNGNVTQKRVASATQSLVTCELTELLPETNYYFAVQAYNSDDQMVAEENGSFATTVVPTYVENTNTQSPTTDCQKIIRNGQLIILRNGVEYNAQGATL